MKFKSRWSDYSPFVRGCFVVFKSLLRIETTQDLGKKLSIQLFNLRSREGSDHCQRNKRNPGNSFNPRSRMGNDLCATRDCDLVVFFNPRSRMGSDQSGRPRSYCADRFNPRSRMGSDRSRPVQRRSCTVSIHAPVWGATRSILYTQADIMFQSTLPYGERLSRCKISADQRGFNPRSRMGSDAFSVSGEGRTGVSIHAPVWGATAACRSHNHPRQFQSTLPYGERPR